MNIRENYQRLIARVPRKYLIYWDFFDWGYYSEEEYNEFIKYCEKQPIPTKKVDFIHPILKKKTYLMFDGNYYKIGESKDPQNKLIEIKKNNLNIQLICYGKNISKKSLQLKYKYCNIAYDWYDLPESQVDKIKTLINNYEDCRLY